MHFEMFLIENSRFNKTRHQNKKKKILRILTVDWLVLGKLQ